MVSFAYEKSRDLWGFPKDSFPENGIKKLSQQCSDLAPILTTPE